MLDDVPATSGSECARTLCKMGFRTVTESDTMITIERGKRIVVVPREPRLPALTLRMILAKAGITVGDFRWFLAGAPWRVLRRGSEPPPPPSV